MLESILFMAIVVLLVLVTGGVAYLTIASWRDNRRAKNASRRR
ncbi:hypothetical protein [Anthocerotibacter panamensis]|nr:hypothetical protein [Anthocerotibacter panamensis]